MFWGKNASNSIIKKVYFKKEVQEEKESMTSNKIGTHAIYKTLFSTNKIKEINAVISL